jgi:hypothetical protein
MRPLFESYDGARRRLDPSVVVRRAEILTSPSLCSPVILAINLGPAELGYLVKSFRIAAELRATRKRLLRRRFMWRLHKLGVLKIHDSFLG